MANPDISVRNLAIAMRLHGDTATDPPEPLNTVLTGIRSTAVELVQSQPLPNVPVAIVNEAVIRVAAYLYAIPAGTPGPGFAQVWKNCGAAGLVEPWRRRRFEAVGDEGGAERMLMGWSETSTFTASQLIYGGTTEGVTVSAFSSSVMSNGHPEAYLAFWVADAVAGRVVGFHERDNEFGGLQLHLNFDDPIALIVGNIPGQLWVINSPIYSDFDAPATFLVTLRS